MWQEITNLAIQAANVLFWADVQQHLSCRFVDQDGTTLSDCHVLS